MCYDLSVSNSPTSIFDPIEEHVNSSVSNCDPNDSFTLAWVITPIMNLQTIIQNNTENNLVKKVVAIALSSLSIVAATVLGLSEAAIRFVLDVTVGLVVTNSRYLMETALYNIYLIFEVADLAFKRLDATISL